MRLPLSCTTWTFEPLPVDEAILRIRDLGFDGADIPVASRLDANTSTSVERQRMRKAAERAGIALSGLHWAIPPGLSYNTPDAGNRQAAVAYFKRVIDLADELGVHAITLGCGYTHRIDPAWDRNDSVKRARDSWEQWARHLEGKRVRVGLEVLSRLDVNVLNTVEECLRFLDGLLGPQLGLTLDTYHMNIEEPDLAAAIARAAQWIRVFQVAENHREVPGTGHLPWRRFMTMLQTVRYEGYISFEIPPVRWGCTAPRDAMKELSQGLSYLKAVLTSV